jgi:dipeptidyl aminopeptidase/acylaminoacyl peptidase
MLKTRTRSAIALLALVALSLVSAPVSAQTGLPPIIDRELIFGNPEIIGAQLSPDGKYIAFRKPNKGTLNVWVKRAEEPFSNARPLTNETRRPIPNFFWSRDSKYVLFTKDEGGDENFNVYAVSPTETVAAGAEVPVARNITEAQKVRAIIYGVPRSEPDAIYVGLNDRDRAWHDLYKVSISTGKRTPIRQNAERVIDWIFDNADQLRLATRAAQSGEREVLRVDADGKFTKVYSCTVFEVCDPIRFAKHNDRVYMQSNEGDTANLVRLILLDPATGREELVEADPLRRVDLEDVMFSDRTNELLLTSYFDDKLRRYFKDKSFEADFQLLVQNLAGKQVSVTSRTADEMRWIVTASSDTEPGEVYLFDRRTKQLKPQYRVRERLPREALATMTAIRYKSLDGLEIPAYLTLPKGVPAKNLPLIVNPHGGPWSRSYWGYSSTAQFFANRGYAVLQPNFRASTGYGKKFLDAGNAQWGDKMQEDLTAGVRHLIREGIVDPKRVGIYGGSYGGYAALAGVTFTPDLYSAAVAVVAPSNLITLLNSIPPYWESERAMFYKRMGDPNTPEGKSQLVRQSPLTHADKIKAPLLVVQGANDPRVNKHESDQIVVALRDRGFPVEYLVAPDEGHGFARPVNNMAMLALAEKFFAKHLGGRYQESMPADVSKRLTEIRVDPKTVVLQASAKK